MKTEKIYVIKRCKISNMATNDFIYPYKGLVEAPDFKDTTVCGNGLHGWTKGFDHWTPEEENGNFVIIEVDKKDGYVELENKVKFRKGKIVMNTPDVNKAHAFMLDKYPDMLLHWNSRNQGDSSSANQGDFSSANQGWSSSANQGDKSSANQGWGSSANQGEHSSTIQGWGSSAIQGAFSSANQGDKSSANQGDFSSANQGDKSSANQGGFSSANQGDKSCANQGKKSVALIRGSNCVYRCASDSGAVILASPYSEDIAIHKAKKNTTLYIIENEIREKYTSTPEQITELKKHEVLVFGSNLLGNHIGGSAKTALQWGAVNGVGEGLQGQTYAFPTLDENMKIRTYDSLKDSIDLLIKCANSYCMRIFLVTRVGTGIAGIDEEYMKSLFDCRSDISANIILPKGWRKTDSINGGKENEEL